ncbi:MAG: UvrD-helicase domain-containing protein [Bdellovibrionota bacterium]
MSFVLADRIERELNPAQREAVLHTHGPLLILAGAGSGKTRILTYRMVHLIESGVALPAEIFAVTFTNKAAREMKHRMEKLLEGSGIPADDIWVSTFHSSGAKLLRMYGSRLGLQSGFSIFDDGDSQTLIKLCLEEAGVSDKVIAPKQVHYKIQAMKNEGLDPLEFKADARNFAEKKMEPVIHAYERGLRRNNAVDFGDLLSKTLELFQKNPDILERFQDQYRFFLVDEYQDTNGVQYQLLKLLASKYRNICVVGDEDQSIYRWRGADIRNILDFEKDYENTKIVKLEENYRSTAHIIRASNLVIANNTQRKAKTLFTNNEAGAPVEVHILESDFEESKWVARRIRELLSAGSSPDEISIFYRTHAQSRLLEDMLRSDLIPYRIFGGLRFYDRAEIKNALAYLRAVANPQDDVSLSRIINVPTRGIGKTSLEALRNLAWDKHLSLGDTFALLAEGEGQMNASARKKMIQFSEMMQGLREAAAKLPLREFYAMALDETGYLQSLRSEDDIEAQTRLENLQELASAIADYESRSETPSLAGFLEEVALYTDQDRAQDEGASVTMMTLHSAKGLEYPSVFLVGLEEELFPSIRGDAFEPDPDEIEEERRLCYVGMTRARKRLFLSSAHVRRVFGISKVRRVSRFISEMPQEEILLRDHAPSFEARRAYNPDSHDSSYDGFEMNRSKSSFSNSDYKAPSSKKADFSEFFDEGPGEDDGFAIGTKVRHPDYGAGVVVARQGAREALKLSIKFSDVGTKKFLAKFAPLEKVT